MIAIEDLNKMDDATFGVEIECISKLNHIELAAKLTEKGILTIAENYNHTTKPHWKIVPDGSLGGYNVYRYTAEVVSRF